MAKAPRVAPTYRANRRNHYRNIGALDRWRDHEGVIHVRTPTRRKYHPPVRENRSRHPAKTPPVLA